MLSEICFFPYAHIEQDMICEVSVLHLWKRDGLWGSVYPLHSSISQPPSMASLYISRSLQLLSSLYRPSLSWPTCLSLVYYLISAPAIAFACLICALIITVHVGIALCLHALHLDLFTYYFVTALLLKPWDLSQAKCTVLDLAWSVSKLYFLQSQALFYALISPISRCAEPATCSQNIATVCQVLLKYLLWLQAKASTRKEMDLSCSM